MLAEGRIFNIQKFSTEDGPGIRTTVFMKGCPLGCTWCANPESQCATPQLGYRESKCRGCGTCAGACPFGAIEMNSEKPFVRIDRKLCTDCGECIDKCGPGALKFFGETRSTEDVFAEVEKDVGYYMKSGGGLTVSGGEPMMQADFVAELFRLSKEIGIETALDTCGYFPSESIEKLQGLLDLVLFDIKIMDREEHKKYTGVYNDLILENLSRFLKTDARVLIRIPLIPNITDTVENLVQIAEFILKTDPSLHVDLLPFHNYGENKYKMIGMEYTLSGVKRQSAVKLDECLSIFTDRGIDCTLH